MEASGPMKISAKAEYACLALLALAQQSADAPPVRIREISDAHAIPERYLVLAVIDGPDTPQRGSGREKRPAARILGVVWDRVRAAERSVLDTTTIAELVAQTSPHEWTI